VINQEEIAVYIEQEIPELRGIIEKSNCRNAYDVVKQLFTYTADQVVKHNIAAAKKCLSLAEQLHKKGNSVVKNAIENVYVYSFSSAFFHDEQKRKEMMQLVPVSLYQLYKKQVVNSHL
jgi:hypothetical protein